MLPGLCLIILRTEKILQFFEMKNSRRGTLFQQEVNDLKINGTVR